MANRTLKIKRAPVLTLWAAVVAERLGYDWATALTLGKALAGLNAQSKGRRLGIYEEKPEEEKEREEEPQAELESVELLGRSVPAIGTPEGLRAASDGEPIRVESVEKYLKQKFKADLDEALDAMRELARAHPPEELNRRGFHLYEKFRPKVPEGEKGWGAAGELDLDFIRSLAE